MVRSMPLVHRGHFAAHGLADIHDAVGGHGFRLHQTQRKLRHRPGGVAHVLGAGNHDRIGKEQHDRQDDRDDQQDQAGQAEYIRGRADLPDLRGKQQLRQADNGHGPQQRHHRRIAQRRIHRAALEIFQHGGGGPATVIGGRLGLALGTFRHLRASAFLGGPALLRLLGCRLGTLLHVIRHICLPAVRASHSALLAFFVKFTLQGILEGLVSLVSLRVAASTVCHASCLVSLREQLSEFAGSQAHIAFPERHSIPDPPFSPPRPSCHRRSMSSAVGKQEGGIVAFIQLYNALVPQKGR